MEILTFATSAAIAALLFYLHRRQLDKAHARGYACGQGDGYRTGYSEKQQLEYSRGYSDGTHDGRLKERLEHETREYKQQRDYDTGYNDALAALAGMNYTTMRDEATTKLSA